MNISLTAPFVKSRGRYLEVPGDLKVTKEVQIQKFEKYRHWYDAIFTEMRRKAWIAFNKETFITRIVTCASKEWYFGNVSSF